MQEINKMVTPYTPFLPRRKKFLFIANHLPAQAGEPTRTNTNSKKITTEDTETTEVHKDHRENKKGEYFTQRRRGRRVVVGKPCSLFFVLHIVSSSYQQY